MGRFSGRCIPAGARVEVRAARRLTRRCRGRSNLVLSCRGHHRTRICVLSCRTRAWRTRMESTGQSSMPERTTAGASRTARFPLCGGESCQGRGRFKTRMPSCTTCCAGCRSWRLAMLLRAYLARPLPWSRSETAQVLSLIVTCVLLNLFILRDPVYARVGGMAGPVAVLCAWMAKRVLGSPHEYPATRAHARHDEHPRPDPLEPLSGERVGEATHDRDSELRAHQRAGFGVWRVAIETSGFPNRQLRTW